jgi:hypothetical protein
MSAPCIEPPSGELEGQTKGNDKGNDKGKGKGKGTTVTPNQTTADGYDEVMTAETAEAPPPNDESDQ